MTEEQTTAVAKTTPGDRLVAAVQKGLDGQRPRLESYLSKMHGDEDRFRMTVLQAVTTTPALMTCSATSIVVAALEAAQLGLEPTGILGGAYLVPYENRKKRIREAKLIVGYRGYIDLLRRAAEVRSIEARVVYENDDFEVRFGTGQFLRHVPWYMVGAEESGSRKAVYWIARLANGAEQFDVLTMAEIEKVRKGSRAADKGPWVDYYDEMAKKTAIRRAVKTLPISVWEARRAVQLEDEAEEGASRAAAEARGEQAGIGGSARDRAVALLQGGAAEEQAAGRGTEAAATAPADGASDSSPEPVNVQAGRPTGSEDPDEGMEGADAALDKRLAGEGDGESSS